MTGRVVALYPDRGFFFIKPDAGGRDVFGHVRCCPGFNALQRGDHVEYDEDWDESRQKMRAINIEVL